MKNTTRPLLAVSCLLLLGATAHAERYSEGEDEYSLFRSAPRATQLVKYYKPTQTYYGHGYVVRYGYATTTPSAAGYTSSRNVLSNGAVEQYLTVANSGSRRDITTFKKAVTLPTKDEQQNKRDVQPAPVKEQKPQPETKVQP